VEGVVDLPPDKRAVAYARLPGVLRTIHKDRDQPVRAGDVIAEVASLEGQSLQLDLLRSHLQLQVLHRTLDRLAPLARSGSPAVSSRQVREAKAALDAEEKRGESLRRRLVQAGLTEAQLRRIVDERQFAESIPVRAPINGVLVRSFATLLQQSKELGTSLSGALRVFSDEMRHKRMSLAEEKAHALPAKMSVPVVVCILPVVLMIAVIPIIVKMTSMH
jgi:multidrug efflux pump subunit AcrA (membrane-fusion protein)